MEQRIAIRQILLQISLTRGGGNCEYYFNFYKKSKDKIKTSSVTGITIIRVAAFAFAIVSWKATSSGLSEYVFGQGWQSALVSFAIQAILFVFNLKLPFYFNRIGENTPNREKKKYRFGVKKGTEKKTYKTTAFQRVIIGFYIIVLGSSSFFSFVYICNYVVYEHQSGYVDDNTILASSYREILNDTDNYITEDTKAMQILASKLLGELQDKYPEDSSKDNSVSKQDLEDAVNEAQDACDIAKEEYDTAKNDADSFKDEMDSYANSRNGTTWHDRQDEWEKKYEAAKADWENAVADREAKKDIYEAAKTALTEAQNALKNYKDSQETVIAEFLLEMLKANPNTDVLEECISELNSAIVDLGTNVDIVDNYSELVEITQTLTVVVKDYTSLVQLISNDDDTGIKYLMEHVMDDMVIPDPTSESFEIDYSSWRTAWYSKLNNLENLIQHLPKLSENEKKELGDTVINTELLEEYDVNDKMNTLAELRRKKVSDINVIEKVFFLLFGKYWFIAWFSLGLAVFFDISSLLAGLFIYGIRKKKSTA
ncbi:hypothetical protein [Blautia sp.]